jgi:hypothetical protein
MTLRNLMRFLPAALLIVVAGCGKDDEPAPADTPAADTGAPPPKVIVEAKPAPAAAPEPAPAPPAPPAPPPPDPAIADAETKAAAIDNLLPTLERRDGQWTLGRAAIRYTIYMNGPVVACIDEIVDSGDAGGSTNKYYFDNGVLFLYREQGHWRETNPPNPMTMREVARAMVFNPEGGLVSSLKTVDGVAAGLSEYESTAVLGQAWHLLSATLKTAETPKAAVEAKPAAQGSRSDGEQPPPAADTADARAAEPADDGNGHVRFESGSTSTEVRGKAAPGKIREYLVRGKAGQLLTLRIKSGGQALFGVYSSRGEIVSDLTDWSGKLPRDGDYRIRVGVAKGGESTDYTLGIELQ